MPAPSQTASFQTTATDTVREGAPTAHAATATSADSPGFESARPSTGEFAAPPSPPADAPSQDALDRQFEILNDAVAALREEVARSYERAQELGAENERLRALVASLRRDLRKSRNANKSLTNHLQALEKRLHEISTPPPQAPSATEATGATSPEIKPTAAPPPPPPPEVAASPPAPPNPVGAASGSDSAASPEDDSD